MSGTFQRLQESLSQAKESASEKFNNVATVNEKVLDMWPNTVDVTKKSNRMTTDHGVKVQDTDHWLKVTSEKKTGPALLEDQISREKIHRCMFTLL
jgi:catalase